MTDAPETIKTNAAGDAIVKFPEWESDVEYRRADLPPTLEQALAVPEVKALVEALQLADGFLKHQGYSEHDPLVRGVIITALAALEGKG